MNVEEVALSCARLEVFTAENSSLLGCEAFSLG
jgi:hypothetical protein